MSRNDTWYHLDNAAKIVPATAGGSDSRVFRVVCELKEEVDPAVLQAALDRTMEDFPHFRCILRRGLFWYYLDLSDIRPQVMPDRLPACEPLYTAGRKSLLFRVTYFRRRVNLEVFHALADGTGGFQFMRALVVRYLVLRHGLPLPVDFMPAASALESADDAFAHFYQKTDIGRNLKKITTGYAYRIRGLRDDQDRSHLLEAVVSAKGFIDIAHRYGVTAGELSVSLFIGAVLDGMARRDLRRPVVVSVPINLRQYFPSETTRNFFGVINVEYNAAQDGGSFESILSRVKASFDEQLTKENIDALMNSYAALEHNVIVRLTPLALKGFVIRRFYKRSRKGMTCTVSNLGRVPFPADLAKYVDRFVGYMASQDIQVCVASFGDRMVFGAASGFVRHTTMMYFVRRLTALGLSAEIATNDYDASQEIAAEAAAETAAAAAETEAAAAGTAEPAPGAGTETSAETETAAGTERTAETAPAAEISSAPQPQSAPAPAPMPSSGDSPYADAAGQRRAQKAVRRQEERVARAAEKERLRAEKAARKEARRAEKKEQKTAEKQARREARESARREEKETGRRPAGSASDGPADRKEE